MAEGTDAADIKSNFTDPSADAPAFQGKMAEGQAPVLEPGKEPIVEEAQVGKDVKKEDAPAKDAPKQEEAPKTDPAERQTLGEGVDPADVVPIDHDDPSIRAVQSLLNESGVTEATAFQIFGKAVESMKLEDIDQAKLVEVLGESKAQLALAGLSQWYNNVASVHLATEKMVHDKFGGKDGWAAARQFFERKGDDPAVKALYGMLDAGGMQAEMAVDRMVSMYIADPSTKTGALPAQVQKAANSGISGAYIESRGDFVRLLEKCRTPEERTKVQSNWLDSKRQRGEL